MDRVKGLANVRIHTGSRVAGFQGDRRLQRVLVEGEGGARALPADAALVRIGVEPVIPAGLEVLERAEAGYLRIDGYGLTSVPWVFAAGDVCNERHQTVAGAVGQGSNAAWSMAGRLGYLVYRNGG